MLNSVTKQRDEYYDKINFLFNETDDQVKSDKEKIDVQVSRILELERQLVEVKKEQEASAEAAKKQHDITLCQKFELQETAKIGYARIDVLEKQLAVTMVERDIAYDISQKLAATVLKYEGNLTQGISLQMAGLEETLRTKDKKNADLEARLAAAEIKIDQNVFRAEGQIKDKRIAELEAQLILVKKDRDAQFTEIKAVVEIQRDTKDKRIAELEAQLIVVKKDRDAQFTEIKAVVEIQRDTKDKRIAELEAQLVEVGAKYDKSKEMSNHLGMRVLQCHYKTQSEEAEDEVKNKRISDLENQNRELYHKIALLRQDLDDRNKDVADLKKLIIQHKSEPSLMLIQERNQHKKEIEIKDTKITELENKISFSQDTVERRNAEIEALKHKVSDNKSEPSLMLLQERKQYKENLDVKDRKITNLEAENKHLKYQLMWLQDYGRHRETEIKDLKTQISQHSDEPDMQLSQARKQYKDAIIDSQKVELSGVFADRLLINQQKDGLARMQTQIDNKIEQINLLSNESMAMEKQIAEKDIEIRWLKNQNAAKDMAIVWKGNDTTAMTKQVDEKDTIINQQKTEIDAKDTTIDQQKTEIDAKDTTIDQQKVEIDAKDTTIDQQKTEIDTLKKQIDFSVMLIDRQRNEVVAIMRSTEQMTPTINRQKHQLDTMESQIRNLVEEAEKKTVHWESITRELRTILVGATNEIDNLKEQVDDKEAQIKNLLEEAKKNTSWWESTAAELRTKLEAATNEVDNSKTILGQNIEVLSKENVGLLAQLKVLETTCDEHKSSQLSLVAHIKTLIKETDDLQKQLNILMADDKSRMIMLVERARETSELIEERKKLWFIIREREAELKALQNQEKEAVEKLATVFIYLAQIGTLTIELHNSNEDN